MNYLIPCPPGPRAQHMLFQVHQESLDRSVVSIVHAFPQADNDITTNSLIYYEVPSFNSPIFIKT